MFYGKYSCHLCHRPKTTISIRRHCLSPQCLYWPRLQATPHNRHTLKVLTVEFDVPVAGRAKTQLSSLVKARRNDDLYSLSDDRESVCGMGTLGEKKPLKLAKRGCDATEDSGREEGKCPGLRVEKEKKQTKHDRSSCWEQRLQTERPSNQSQRNGFKNRHQRLDMTGRTRGRANLWYQPQNSPGFDRQLHRKYSQLTSGLRQSYRGHGEEYCSQNHLVISQISQSIDSSQRPEENNCPVTADLNAVHSKKGREEELCSKRQWHGSLPPSWCTQTSQNWSIRPASGQSAFHISGKSLSGRLLQENASSISKCVAPSGIVLVIDNDVVRKVNIFKFQHENARAITFGRNCLPYLQQATATTLS